MHSNHPHLARARHLVAAIDTTKRRIERLTQFCEATQAQFDALSQQFYASTDFHASPQFLADHHATLSNRKPHIRHHILFRYTRYLQELVESPFSGGHPIKVDFAAMPYPARPYFCAAFLGHIVNGVLPRVDLDGPAPATGTFRLISTAGPIDEPFYRAKRAILADWLGGTWEITAATSNSLTFTRRAPLPAILPWSPAYLRSGALFVGLDTATRQPVHLNIADMTAGTLLNGASGSGKSVGVHVIIQSILANLPLFDAIYLIDGKDGVELNSYARRSPKIRVLWDEPDVWALAAQITATIRQRQAIQRTNGIKKITRGFIAILVDETSTFTAKHSDKKGHAAFIDNLSHIARRGRSAGIRCIFTTQSPTDAQIPTDVRNNCDTIIAFRTPIDVHATALMGKLDDLPADPRILPKGHALVRNDKGDTHHVQFPMLPQSGIRR